jgi:hypothetical protein
MDWGMIGVILAALGLMMAWMNRKFDNIDNHVLEAHKRIDATNARLDANFNAICARSEQISARVDTTQSIIMRMLEKQGK